MPLFNIYSLYRTMEEANVLLLFKGIVTNEFLTSVLKIVENKMQMLNEPPVKIN